MSSCTPIESQDTSVDADPVPVPVAEGWQRVDTANDADGVIISPMLPDHVPADVTAF
jgi:hypothetical protein